MSTTEHLRLYRKLIFEVTSLVISLAFKVIAESQLSTLCPSFKTNNFRTRWRRLRLNLASIVFLMTLHHAN